MASLSDHQSKASIAYTKCVHNLIKVSQESLTHLGESTSAEKHSRQISGALLSRGRLAGRALGAVPSENEMFACPYSGDGP
jgi:hypothetical protein